MLIDQTQVLFEGPVATAAANVVSLTAMKFPGKMNPIPVTLKITSAVTAASGLTIKLQQADSETGSFADVPNSTIIIASADCAKVGRVEAVKYLPREVTKGFIKAVVSGGTAGNIYFGLGREDEEGYEAGLYINKGVVEG